MGAALAGSISGTVAWFQYSTRVQAAFIGTSAHCSEALEIKSMGPTASDWATELDSSKVKNLDGYGTKLAPISSGALTADAALTPANFYKNPVYQVADSSKWGAASNVNFVQLKFQFHLKDIDGGNSASYLGGHKLYLTDLSIVSLKDGDPSGQVVDANNDLYKAIRVHVASGDYHKTFAAGSGSANTMDTDVHGNLDLNNDGSLDRVASYEWESQGALIDYGASGIQTVYDVKKAGVLANDSDPTNISAGVAGEIGTIASGLNGLEVTVTMWIEGWTKLDVAPTANAGNTSETADASAVWDPATYIGKNFGVGFRFATSLHADNE